MRFTYYHVFQAARKGSMFLIPHIIRGFSIARSNETSISIYVVQVILLLVAPALSAANIYMSLGRLILLTQGESMAPIRAKWLTKIFMYGDVLSFLVQSASSSMASKASSVSDGSLLIKWSVSSCRPSSLASSLLPAEAHAHLVSHWHFDLNSIRISGGPLHTGMMDH
ncbi:uncharacterized protein K444DRAFT_719015 [Hyaloscypha bicolor E]|uniref:Uncharacterized protein n=1 Tax=Hyaloscypha bicolor E TaxID=1095630 RepID=A0A2J6TGR0_9HELO|nr:uncharacterized protein K444DRAFT_719015 [Hyaloscypha bicolor E]PMD62148.1 hypothetical protein K444DRAFT_719015 [Hyaloscypha bicolor E]